MEVSGRELGGARSRSRSGVLGGKKMTKKARGIEPCLAYESWSSVEESADPLQHSLKFGGKILLFDRAGQSGAALQLLQLACSPSGPGVSGVNKCE